LSGAFPNAFQKSRKLPIYSVKREEKVVSLSFDAAWGNEQTQHLLDTLDEFEVKSTFFLVGMWVDKYPDSVKAIFNAGHDVGNHSNTHPQMPKLDDERMRNEIEECNKKIEKITKKRPILFRPPYGNYNDKLIETTNTLDMYCIQWNIDSLDWKDLKCDEMKKRIIPKLKPGSIILMHNGAKYTPESLGEIIYEIKKRGFKIVPISEIIYKENYRVEHDGMQIANQNSE
jgi:polysaccharide deacetylase family sporulation protein PdaB